MTAKCDFCAEPPTWHYPVRDFGMYVLGVRVANSTGGSAACQVCYEMIEAGRWLDLLARSINTSGLAEEIRQDRRLAEQVGYLHKQFRDNRLGPAEVWE